MAIGLEKNEKLGWSGNLLEVVGMELNLEGWIFPQGTLFIFDCPLVPQTGNVNVWNMCKPLDTTADSSLMMALFPDSA